MKIVTIQQMRAIEQASVAHGVSLDQLQRNAAAAVAAEIERLFPDGAGPALFLAGPGNNGRDALIAAALLAETGRQVRVYLAPKVGSEDVIAQLQGEGAALHVHAEDDGRAVLAQWTREAYVVVDGLLGIGSRGPVREPIAGIIGTVYGETFSNGIPVVAVDLPSGIDADSGEVPGAALHADFTISLGCVKAGLLKFPAAEYVGTLLPVGIGLPPEGYQSIRLELLTGDGVAGLIPTRKLNAHKGTFGRVLVVAGSRNFVGASYLVGGAAARSGCGLVTFAVPEWQRGSLAVLLPEATYLPLFDWDDVEQAQGNADAITQILPDCSALAIGPGQGQGEGQRRLVVEVLESNRRTARIPVVVDADGLNALALEPKWWDRIGSGHVLTPHPGEMARLSGLAPGDVQRDRWGVALEMARRWGQTVVLKGAFTVVADPRGDGWVSPFAIPALASAGTGDVLTGLIAGLMAQGVNPLDAARAGVYLHALAAQRQLDGSHTDRLLASDLLPMIPHAIMELLSGPK